MSRSNRRVQIDDSDAPRYDQNGGGGEEEGNGTKLRSSSSNVSDDQEPFMGVKVRRKASLHRDVKGGYIDVPSHPRLMKILHKQGDKQILFADKVLKFTEYDLLMASTRKTEVVTVLVEHTKSASNYDLDVEFSNR
ncbi:hypothetical protein LINPERPRIM_LOCUS11865 [Linum perenne]